MEIILQKELPHQQNAVNAVCKVFDEVELYGPKAYYENPTISHDRPRIAANIAKVQRDMGIPAEHKGIGLSDGCLNLDVKMETGTGKTYVYTHTIYELNRLHGFNKFIIAVPSLAIKAGTGQFISDTYVRRHFRDACGYGTEIELGVLEPVKKKKKGHSYFPTVVAEFVKGSCRNSHKIYVLLVNMQMMKVAANYMLSRNDYDFGVEGFYRPFDALRATKPIVIIDEPHRFSRDQKAYKVILSEIQPQCIIRYGATFPDTVIGKGKNKTSVKDYQNLLYDLNACMAFNKGLIKVVAKEHFEPVSGKDERVKITSVENKECVHLRYEKADATTRTYTLHTGDPLSVITPDFEGITISAIGTSTVEFSNGMVKNQGEELNVDVYMSSYQEQMLRLALERHFETERKNFCERKFKIKTLALFFIDDISSYRKRKDENSKVPYLREMFEQLLKEKLQSIIASLGDNEREYKKYLEASLADIGACHEGYFAQDNLDTDEAIAGKIKMILNGKKQLISFTHEDGTPNTLRFLFSKWTLKEGWDNPNVFTITKLRSSGSEISKLQEVGRGLRLPVDENGNRISNEEFMLNYIVDFNERKFAEELVNEINNEVPEAIHISEEKLISVAQALGISDDELFEELCFKKHYIDRHYKIIPEYREALFEEYPQFKAGIDQSKVKDRNKEKPRQIKIRKAAYEEIRSLWEILNKRYTLCYDKDLDASISDAVLGILENDGIFTDVAISSKRNVVVSDGNTLSVNVSTGKTYIINRQIAYGTFLKKISTTTNIPVNVMHKALVEYSKRHGTIDKKYFNEFSVSTFERCFNSWKAKNLQGRFNYARSTAPIGGTALSYPDGTPREDIAQGRIGTKIVPGTPSAKYLYDTYAYDSPLERDNITSDIDEVIVYGKIPRSSIAIPVISGGTYSPDFMYVVKRANGEKEINIVVETKDVENKTELREEEQIKIGCAKVFFDMLKKDGFQVQFHTQLNNKKMAQIIKDALRIEN